MKNYRSNENDEPLSVNEPALPYGSSNYFEMAKRGVTKQYIQNVIGKTKLTVQEIITLLPISIDTYKRKTIFGAQVTEKILEIEEVYTKGFEAFGDGFIEWMNAINPALGGIRPKSLLLNSFGIRRLINTIGRIQHGVLA